MGRNELIKEINYLKNLSCNELIELAKTTQNNDEISIYIHFYNLKLAENAKKFLNKKD